MLRRVFVAPALSARRVADMTKRANLAIYLYGVSDRSERAASVFEQGPACRAEAEEKLKPQ
jgi:hypothetical protein